MQFLLLVMQQAPSSRLFPYTTLFRSLYERRKEYAQALEHYQRALELLDGEQEPGFYGVVLHDIEDVNRDQSARVTEAESYRRAAESKEHAGKVGDLVTTLQAQAEVLQ